MRKQPAVGSRDPPQGSRARIEWETLVLAGPRMLVPGPGLSPGITVALAGPWGSPFALSLTLLVSHVAKMQPCLRGGLGEIGMRNVLSSAPPFLGEPHWPTGLGLTPHPTPPAGAVG